MLTNIMQSRMIGREIQYEKIQDNPEGDINLDISERKYEVNSFLF